MARCTRTRGLDVHHKRRDGGNDLSNAEVLCSQCHAATTTYGVPGRTPPAFTEQTRQAAMRHAGNQCECTKTGGCH